LRRNVREEQCALWLEEARDRGQQSAVQTAPDAKQTHAINNVKRLLAKAQFEEAAVDEQIGSARIDWALGFVEHRPAVIERDEFSWRCAMGVMKIATGSTAEIENHRPVVLRTNGLNHLTLVGMRPIGQTGFVLAPISLDLYDRILHHAMQLRVK